MTRAALDLDTSVPLLVVKIGPYPLHHGGVGVIRSLGRRGVPVYAVTESRATPAALSRYLRGRVVWPTTGLEDPDQLVAGLLAVGRDLARRSRRAGHADRVIALPTDDEAALLLAEHPGELEECFISPAVAPGLPRSLANKDTLAEQCAAHAIPCPISFLPESVEQMVANAASIGYPVVVKNARPWQRLLRPGVGSSTVVADEVALRHLARELGRDAERVGTGAGAWRRRRRLGGQRVLRRLFEGRGVFHGCEGQVLATARRSRVLAVCQTQ